MPVDANTRGESVLAISNLKAHYCHLVDEHRYAEFAELFAEDATFDLSEMHYALDPRTGRRVSDPKFSDEYLDSASGAGMSTWPIVGRANIRDYVQEGGKLMRFAHHVFVPEIQILTATTARAVWPMEDRIWFDPGAPFTSLHGIGHYHETYTAVDGVWQIQSLKLTRQHVFWS